MIVGRHVVGFVATAGIVGWCDVASATYRPATYDAPLTDIDGLLRLGIWTAFALLTGVVERPFYSRAGVEKHALAYSLLANLASAFVIAFFAGIVRSATIVSDVYLRHSFDEVWLIFIPVAIVAGAAIEYAMIRDSQRGPIEFTALLSGNACSWAVFAAIWIAAASPLGQRVRGLFFRHEADLAYACIAASTVMALGVIAPLVLRRWPASGSKDPDDAA